MMQNREWMGRMLLMPSALVVYRTKIQTEQMIEQAQTYLPIMVIDGMMSSNGDFNQIYITS